MEIDTEMMDQISAQSKNLLRHALPVTLVVASMMIMAMIAAAGLTTTGPNPGMQVARDGFSRVIHVQPSDNGTVKVSTSQQTAAQTTVGNEAARAGKTAQSSFGE